MNQKGLQGGALQEVVLWVVLGEVVYWACWEREVACGVGGFVLVAGQDLWEVREVRLRTYRVSGEGWGGDAFEI